MTIIYNITLYFLNYIYKKKKTKNKREKNKFTLVNFINRALSLALTIVMNLDLRIKVRT